MEYHYYRFECKYYPSGSSLPSWYCADSIPQILRFIYRFSGGIFYVWDTYFEKLVFQLKK